MLACGVRQAYKEHLRQREAFLAISAGEAPGGSRTTQLKTDDDGGMGASDIGSGRAAPAAAAAPVRGAVPPSHDAPARVAVAAPSPALLGGRGMSKKEILRDLDSFLT